MSENVNIKLFVSCHHESFVPKHPLLCPIQVGTSLNEQEFPDMLHDNFGEHISDRNREFCELTAQYWAWRNVETDFYGFFHYRRYLYPHFNTTKPYEICGNPSERLLKQLHFSQFENLIPEYEIILPKSENMWIPVEKHYDQAPFHHTKDLEIMKSILIRQQPQYKKSMEWYFSESHCYFGNIFIMRREVFLDYCDWLFPLLFAFEKEADLSGYSEQEKRVFGYLGERLLGVYYTHWREKLRCLELPRVHFEDDFSNRVKRQAINAVLPAGSWRRYWVKGRVNT